MSKSLRRSLLIFIIKAFRTIVFIFIVISTTFRPICPPAFFRCLSNSGTFMDVVRSSVKVPEFDKHLKKAGGHIDRNVAEITIKMKTIIRKPLMIKNIYMYCKILYLYIYYILFYILDNIIYTFLYYINYIYTMRVIPRSGHSKDF